MALRAPFLCLLLCFFLFPGVKGTLVAYASFDQPGVLTALCPAASYSVSSSGVTIQSSTPVPGLGGNYASIDGTAGSGLSVDPTLLPFIGDTFFATGTTQFSVTAWVNLDGVALPDFSGAYGEINVFGASTGNLPRLVIGEKLMFGNAVGCRTPRFYIGQQSKPAQDTLDDVFPNDNCTVNFKRQLPNVWHHVAGIFDGSALQVFLDGQALGFPVAFNGTEYPFWDQALRIGGGPTGSAPFRGLLDDVRVYDSALTAEDIADLFQKRSTLVNPAALNTVQPAPPSNIGLLRAGQQVNLTVQGVDAANHTGELSYFWADFTTSGCTLASFATPNDASPGLTFFGLSPSIAIGGGVSNGDLCLTNIYKYNVSGTPATLQKGPANLTTVYLNEFSDVSVDVTGFPSPSFQWQVRVTRQVIYPNLTVGPQTVFVPIPDEIEPTLSIFNANGTFSRIPAGSRRASSPITVRCVFKNSLSGGVIPSEAVEVIPLDVFRPETSGGDGGDDDTNVAAIVVPVVVGPILLCLLCLLILLVVVLVVLARRRGGEWKPDMSKPDYEALAYGKFLDSPPSASKKQVAALKKLEELLLDSDYLLTRLLCDNAKATEADGVAKVVTYLYAAHGEAVGLVQYFITKEVETSNKEGTLFRANSISSKMFTTYSRVIALEYVWRIFAYPVAELEHLAEVATGETSGMGGSQTTIMGPMAMEVDPSKMEEAADDQINTLELWLVAQKLFSGMVKEKGSVPSEVRQMLRHVQSEVASKFSEQAAHKAMGGFLFLRLLCPSLMAPQVYGLLKAPPNAVAQRQLILIAKVMQNLANDTLPGKKEGYMERLNEFITSNQDRLRSFYSDLIAHADDGPHPSLTVPENVKTNSLIQLHKFISANYDKLSAIIQQEDEGLAEELQEVMDSIGTIDAEEL